MSSSRRAFSRAEIRYLRSLPAVANVTASRITYADAFRDKATERYNSGDSPTRIFREAGLGPEIIGYKRIERAFARWKSQSKTAADKIADEVIDMSELPDAADMPDAPDLSGASDETANVSKPDIFDVHTVAPRQLMEMAADDNLRDRLIAGQALRIAELEEQVKTLERKLAGQRGKDSNAD